MSHSRSVVRRCALCSLKRIYGILRAEHKVSYNCYPVRRNAYHFLISDLSVLFYVFQAPEETFSSEQTTVADIKVFIEFQPRESLSDF